MKVNIETVLKNFDGTELLYKEGVPASLRLIIIDALLVPPKPPSVLSAMDSITRFEFARRVFNAKEGELVEMSVEEIALLKMLIAAAFAAPLFVGQACMVLENPNAAQQQKEEVK